MTLGTIVRGVTLVCTLTACGDGGYSGPSGPGSSNTAVTVTAGASNTFVPATLDIAVGQTVTWVFGPVDHNVIFNPVAGAPEDIPIVRNTSVSRTFRTAGVFPYVCTLHAGMTGMVRVAPPISPTVGYAR